MSEFGNFPALAEVTLLSDGRVQLQKDFRYIDPSGQVWVAPANTKSDGATIPRFAWALVGGPLDGPYRDAAIIHDVACEDRVEPWWVVHQVFYYGMRARQVGNVKASIMYAAVYHFGPRWETTAKMRGFDGPVTIPVPAPPVTMTKAEFDELAADIERRDEQGDPMSLAEISAFTQQTPAPSGTTPHPPHEDQISPVVPPPLPEPAPIVIYEPIAGDTIYATALHVSWGCTADTEDPSFARILLKEGVELQRVGPVNYTGRPRADLLNLFGRMSGTDYTVKVELYDWNYDLEAPEYVTSATSGYFTFINQIIEADERYPVVVAEPVPGLYPTGSELEIYWHHHPTREPHLRVRVSLVRDSTEGGGEWTIDESRPSWPCWMTWTIPDDVPPGDGYRIRVEQTDGPGVDVSHRPFSISHP